MRSTLTVEEQFERELEIFRTEAETAAQFFYAFLAIHAAAGEEIILNDATYVPRAWPVTDPRARDEWNLSPIPAAMM